eukprot:m.113568 g.113568  ORF g.113568 m.113568 type:complete len:1135 (-) comp13027_c0_seq1:1812-5216(-)
MSRRGGRHQKSPQWSSRCFTPGRQCSEPNFILGVSLLTLLAVFAPTSAVHMLSRLSISTVVEHFEHPRDGAAAVPRSKRTGSIESCRAYQACLLDPLCNACWQAVKPSSGHSLILSGAETRDLETQFYSTLRANTSCATASIATLQLLNSTLNELIPSSQQCLNDTNVAQCQATQFGCFSDAPCRTCTDELQVRGNIATFNSTACRTLNPDILRRLQKECKAFPGCSLAKANCSTDHRCRDCLAAVVDGDSTVAARRCHDPMSRRLLDDVVLECVDGNLVSCDYWQARCQSSQACAACNKKMAHTSDVVAGLNTTECKSVLNDTEASVLLTNVVVSCPASVWPTCHADIVFCFLQYPGCSQCLHSPTNPQCRVFYNGSRAAIGVACKSCPDSIHRTNVIVLVTTVVGSVSAVLCSACLIVLVSSREIRSLRGRIVGGLLLANAVYSIGNAIPINKLQTGESNCGESALSFRVIIFGRALWFGGKYAMAVTEVLLLGASLCAVRYGAKTVSVGVEIALHVSCGTAAVTAFTCFYLKGMAIHGRYLNSATENEAYSSAYNYASLHDDRDDDLPGVASLEHFANGQAEFDSLIQRMLIVWNGILGFALIMWLLLRLVYLRTMRLWRSYEGAAHRNEILDEWADTRRSLWVAHRELIAMQQRAYTYIARPLELYVAVFVPFGVPAVLMSTEWCNQRSGVTSKPSKLDIGTVSLTYGSCDTWCELILAFRSIATVCVFVFQYWFQKTSQRRHRGRHVGYVEVQSEDIELTSPIRGNDNEPSIEQTQISHNDWLIATHDIVLEKRLAAGRFGVVWQGAWRNEVVAVKILQNAVDEEGDALVGMDLEVEFEKECAALMKVNHPNLLQIFGFGKMPDGNYCIVTEFMALGSLNDLIVSKQNVLLNWQTKVSISLQLAQGMAHLHKIPLIHRDLKSANVLLASNDIAKVGDFGSSRVLRPRRFEFFRDPFTGHTTVLSPDAVDIATGAINLLQQTEEISPDHLPGAPLPRRDSCLSTEVGTMFWMAPELFRGDQRYSWPVDVYSFGIILWELMSLEQPWPEFHNTDYLEAFAGLGTYLRQGVRPDVSVEVEEGQPQYVTLMRSCWAGEPTDRPPFTDIIDILAAILRATHIIFTEQQYGTNSA